MNSEQMMKLDVKHREDNSEVLYEEQLDYYWIGRDDGKKASQYTYIYIYKYLYTNASTEASISNKTRPEEPVIRGRRRLGQKTNSARCNPSYVHATTHKLHPCEIGGCSVSGTSAENNVLTRRLKQN